MKAIIVNIHKKSAYAHLLGLTFEVKEIMSRGANGKMMFCLSVNGTGVDFTCDEIMIVDFATEMQMAFDNHNFYGRQEHYSIYYELCMYASLKGIKFTPEYTCPALPKNKKKMKNRKTIDGNGIIYFSAFQDENGNNVERTKFTHPYSYDGFVTWRGVSSKKQDKIRKDTVYSDRLYQWDWEKYNKLCKKYFGDVGQYFSNRNPKKIEAMLQEYCKEPKLNLTLIMEYCNQSSGYPVWRFDFEVPKEVKGTPKKQSTKGKGA